MSEVCAGDCYYIDRLGHFYVVISDPIVNQDRVAIVNFTEWRDDHRVDMNACVVERGDHEIIVKKSCINYKDARKYSKQQIINFVNQGYFVIKCPVSADLLARIPTGVRYSRMRLEWLATLLEDQGLLPDPDSLPPLHDSRF